MRVGRDKVAEGGRVRGRGSLFYFEPTVVFSSSPSVSQKNCDVQIVHREGSHLSSEGLLNRGWFGRKGEDRGGGGGVEFGSAWLTV